MNRREHWSLKFLTKEYLKERLTDILIRSDLLTTRTIIGLSSLLFSSIVSYHYFTHDLSSDLFWMLFSLFHALVTFYALFSNRITRFTFFGEAVCGFILWNYISMFAIFSEKTLTLASASPTIVISMTTWWILSRYPLIKK